MAFPLYKLIIVRRDYEKTLPLLGTMEGKVPLDRSLVPVPRVVERSLIIARAGDCDVPMFSPWQ